MSMAALRSNIRGMVQQMLAAIPGSKLGIVTDYDSARPAVKVTIQPEEIETGWLQLMPMLSGPSFGIFVGPTAGLLAVIVFQEGDTQVGICLGFLPNDLDVPPKVAAGQMLVVDSSGSSLAFTNDGKIALVAPNGLTITANVQINGAVVATGEGTFNGGHTVSQHIHTQPSDSHGDTEAPTNQPTG